MDRGGSSYAGFKRQRDNGPSSNSFQSGGGGSGRYQPSSSHQQQRPSSFYGGGNTTSNNAGGGYPQREFAQRAPHDPNKMKLVVILERCGLWLGRDGLVDAHEKAASTQLANDSLADIRPDIVHQCLLALCDSDLYHEGGLQIILSTVKGKTIKLSQNMRPPRTFHRFKGLMESLLRDGQVVASSGEVLMKTLIGTVAPLIPHEAEVVGLCNASVAPILSASALGKQMATSPTNPSLQGGERNTYGFIVVPCTEDVDLAGLDYVTKTVCLSEFPAAAHVLCARAADGLHMHLGKRGRREAKQADAATHE